MKRTRRTTKKRRHRFPTEAEARARFARLVTPWERMTPAEREAFEALARVTPEVCGQSPYLLTTDQILELTRGEPHEV